MTARRIWLVLPAALLIAAACTGSTGSRSQPASPSMGRGSADQLAPKLQAALDDSMDDSDAPGAQATVVFADGTVWSGGSGLADVEAGRRVTPHTLFAIASITKTFTAALVFRLVEDGLVSLDDPLTRWLPDFPHAAGVTVRQLLGSTSGLAALAPSDIAAILRRDPHHRFTDREVYLPPACDPGACYHYQGPNYGLLGRIVEDVTGGSLASAYRGRLFHPLGLDQSFFAPQEPVRGDVAIGYGRDSFDTRPADDTVQEVKISPTTLPGAGGAIVSTAEDVARFAAALFGGRVLEDGSLSTMLDFEAVHGLPGMDECFADSLGVSRGSALERETWGHGGFSGNFHTTVEYFPREHVTVAVFLNSGSNALGAMTDAVATAALRGAQVVDPTVGRGFCNFDIYSIRTDGTRFSRLTTDPSTDGSTVSWSPDNTRMVFGSYRDGNTEIYSMNRDGSDQVNLTDDPSNDRGGAWSPDGERIAFFSDRTGHNEIYVMGADGSNVQQLTYDRADAILPAWSPDSSRIAYETGEPERHDIWVMDAHGSQAARVSGYPEDDDTWPTWSPDGARIAFVASGVTNVTGARIYLTATDGSARVRLILPFPASFPAWGPTDRIAVVSEAMDIFTVAPDGTQLEQVTSTPAGEFGPAWSTDGTLAFSSERWEERA